MVLSSSGNRKIFYLSTQITQTRLMAPRHVLNAYALLRYVLGTYLACLKSREIVKPEIHPYLFYEIYEAILYISQIIKSLS